MSHLTTMEQLSNPDRTTDFCHYFCGSRLSHTPSLLKTTFSGLTKKFPAPYLLSSSELLHRLFPPPEHSSNLFLLPCPFACSGPNLKFPSLERSDYSLRRTPIIGAHSILAFLSNAQPCHTNHVSLIQRCSFLHIFTSLGAAVGPTAAADKTRRQL